MTLFNMPLLRLENIDLHYGSHILMDGLNLNISKGNKIGLLGRNGTGKTTLLKIILLEQTKKEKPLFRILLMASRLMGLPSLSSERI